MIQITDKPILSDVLRSSLQDRSCGALVVFEGLVRDHHLGKKVVALSYQCYRPMAFRILNSIREAALERWEITELFIIHRVGKIPIGEAAVFVAVTSAHRQEAFEACAWAMDEIKLEAPIWKRETYDDGISVWVEDHCVQVHDHA